jgi:hypothetical protein
MEFHKLLTFTHLHVYAIQIYKVSRSFSFSSSTGLKVNYKKTSMVPINIIAEYYYHLADIFRCKAESLPFTYRGLPMGTTKPRMENPVGVLERIDRRLVVILE